MTNPTAPPQGIVERLGALLVGLAMGIGGRVSWGGISSAANVLIGARLMAIKRRVDRIVAQIRAGTYKPRRTGKPRARASPSPRPPQPPSPPPPSPLPAKFGWLMPFIPVKPEEVWHANGFSQGVEAMLNTPEMVALVEAAPVSLGRPLRSLCWALRLKPPPHLAPPRRTRPRPATPPPARPRAKAQRLPPLPARPPTHPDAPAWMRNWPPPVRGSRKLT
jgi:hypothetical protein